MTAFTFVFFCAYVCYVCWIKKVFFAWDFLCRFFSSISLDESSDHNDVKSR